MNSLLLLSFVCASDTAESISREWKQIQRENLKKFPMRPIPRSNHKVDEFDRLTRDLRRKSAIKLANIDSHSLLTQE